MKLSILVPVYNEEKRVTQALKEITACKISGWAKEIIVINDGSKDKSLALIQKFKNKVIIISHTPNRGKGFALKQGITKATGDYVLIQDADLEYHPKDIPKLLTRVPKNKAVYGSRFLGKMTGISKTHYFGNKFLSLTTSVLYGQHITDMETGYKLIERELLTSLNLESDDFRIEPEITLKLLKRKVPITEVPITYTARIKEEKKISVKDGFKALFYLVRNKFM